jgi:predicted peroxiredoxin
MKIILHPMNLEDCLKKVEIRKVNGDEWLFLKEPCDDCSFSGEVKIYYCRSRQVYLRQYKEKDDKQLELPYKER